ncbi:MAG: hypothetical protein A4E65_00189 [Syntrophorhabdus sp. PtaU1.Bin153]|nr:MAG: hypothetical protein A4E65_00189 [Syntrophorhabdus sp. PtaU1.Bin153]
MPENGRTWHFLIVEDDLGMIRNIEEILPASVPTGDTAIAEKCTSFDDAQRRMTNSRYDLLILDLKDNTADLSPVDSDPPGVTVFQELKKYRFTPVIFYTGWAGKVREYENSFVRVVEKTEDVSKLREAIKAVFATRLPTLSKLIDEVERDYLWEFISTHWQDTQSHYEQSDLAHLVARRLSIALTRQIGEYADGLTNPKDADPNKSTIHPMTVYVYPPLYPARMAGDILFEKDSNPKNYWLILTPACDLTNHDGKYKAEHILLAKCEELKAQEEYIAWEKDKTKRSSLEELVVNNRKGKRSIQHGDKSVLFSLQRDRFRFLPGTYFLPDLVVDFQQLKTVPYGDLALYDIAASLDSPYAEWIITSFAGYFGRVGVPDIDKKAVINRVEALLAESAAAEPESPPDRGVKDEATR